MTWLILIIIVGGGSCSALIDSIHSKETLSFKDRFKRYEISSLHKISALVNSTASDIEKNPSGNRYLFFAFGQTFDFNIGNFEASDLPVVQILNNKGPVEIFAMGKEQGLYQGTLKGDNMSHVVGYFLNGTFTGSIVKGSETFYVEPYAKYFRNDSKATVVVYRSADINYSHFGLKSFKEGQSFKSRRFRRAFKAAKKQVNSWKGKSCDIELVADYTFFNKMNKSLADTISVMLYHVKTADDIFRKTDFDEDGQPDDLRLLPRNISILTEPKWPEMNRESATVFIKNFAERSQNYCLSVCFCYRSFFFGIMAIAFRGDYDGEEGGICQIPVRNSKFHTNTAVVTIRSDDMDLPLAITSNAFTHEIGHSFGSNEDPIDDPICSPGSKWGNYIMYPFAVDSSEPHHNLFSQCSRKRMRTVIEMKGTCLKSKVASTCGNGIKEDGEECDCGTLRSCHLIDYCCTPKGGIDGDLECTFRRNLNYECSPVDSPCCEANCSIVSYAKRLPCAKDASSCRRSICNGKSPECPWGFWLPDKAPCQENSKTCSAGRCNSTVCRDVGLVDCNCPDGGKDDCHICCLNQQAQCLSAETLNLTVQGGGKYLKVPGSWCSNFTGQCTDEGICMSSFLREDDSPPWYQIFWPHTLILLACVLVLCTTGWWYRRYRSRKRTIYDPANTNMASQLPTLQAP